MSSHAPNPSNPYLTPTRLRVRWESFLIAGVVLALASVGVLMLVYGGTTPATPTATPRATTELTPTDATAAPIADADVAGDALGIDESRGLLDEARSLALDARWDEALDRLTSITDPAVRATLAADTEVNRVTTARQDWTRLGLQLDAQVAAHQWQLASDTLTKLGSIAHLNDSQLATQAQVLEALAAPAATATAPAAPATTPAPARRAAATPAPATSKPAARPAASAALPPAASARTPKLPTTNGSGTGTHAAPSATGGAGTAADLAGDENLIAFGDLVDQGLDTLPDA